MIRFGLLAAPGLGSAVEHELRLRGIEVLELRSLWLRNHDLIIISGDKFTLKPLLRMRTVDDIFVILAEEVAIENKQELRRLTPKSLRKEILESLPLLPPRRQKRVTTHFAVFVKQDSDQELYRREIERAMVVYLQEQFARWKVSDPADVEFWAFYVRKKVTLGLRLTRPSFRQRRYRFEDRPGALRPTVAAALVALSDPKDGDVVVDPMCGSGTVLLERALWGESATLIGCDMDSDALEIARGSAEKANVSIDWHAEDATRGKVLEDFKGSVSHIISNLPFGKKFPSEDLPGLYSKALTAWKPLLRSGGKMILLTPNEKELREAAKKLSLSVRGIEKIRIKGLEAQVFRVAAY